MKQTEFRKSQQDEDEVSLVDIIHFFSCNWKFLALMTLGLSVSAIILLLFQPKQYQKQLTLSVIPVPVSLSVQFPNLDINQTGVLSATLLRQNPPDNIVAKPTYDITTQQISVILESTIPSSLSGVSPKIVSQLETGFQKTLDKSVENTLNTTELQLKKYHQILSQLDQQITQLSFSKTAKLEAIETQRAVYIAGIASLEFDQQYLKQARKNMAEFAAQVYSVQILVESETQQTRSIKQIAVLAIIASFIVAVFATIIRDQGRRLNEQLSQQKIKGGMDV